MELFLQQMFNGIMFGSTYAIVALGLTLVMGILEIPNFAHGHLYMLGGYITYFFIHNSIVLQGFVRFMGCLSRLCKTDDCFSAF